MTSEYTTTQYRDEHNKYYQENKAWISERYKAQRKMSPTEYQEFLAQRKHERLLAKIASGCERAKAKYENSLRTKEEKIEHRRQKHLQYYYSNRQVCNESSRQYYHNNKEHIKERYKMKELLSPEEYVKWYTERRKEKLRKKHERLGLI